MFWCELWATFYTLSNQSKPKEKCSKISPTGNQKNQALIIEIPLSTIKESVPKAKFNFKLIILFKQLQKTGILLFSFLLLPKLEKEKSEKPYCHHGNKSDGNLGDPSIVCRSSMLIRLHSAIFWPRWVIGYTCKHEKKKKPENLIEFPESYMHCLHFFPFSTGSMVKWSVTIYFKKRNKSCPIKRNRSIYFSFGDERFE